MLLIQENFENKNGGLINNIAIYNNVARSTIKYIDTSSVIIDSLLSNNIVKYSVIFLSFN